MSCKVNCFKTLKDRVHFYIFFFTSLILCFQVVEASAYESIKLSHHNPEIVEHSMLIQLAVK